LLNLKIVVFQFSIYILRSAAPWPDLAKIPQFYTVLDEFLSNESSIARYFPATFDYWSVYLFWLPISIMWIYEDILITWGFHHQKKTGLLQVVGKSLPQIYYSYSL
jgi:hypothetical protein